MSELWHLWVGEFVTRLFHGTVAIVLLFTLFPLTIPKEVVL